MADSCFALVNGDEGWEELRYKVEHSDMEYRKEVLNIIDSVPIMKGREGQLQRLKEECPIVIWKNTSFRNCVEPDTSRCITG